MTKPSLALLVNHLKVNNLLSLSKISIVIAASLVLFGCATPSEKFIDTAKQFGFSLQELEGKPYRHRLFANSKAESGYAIRELHVYLDGDGTPWQAGTHIATDPTPRNPLILKLMRQDLAPAILLGRPCYYGLNGSPLCDNTLWTSHRYAATVVDSMQTALKRWSATKKIDRLVLIGFSGGGALATLLAPHLEKTTSIVTLAANLDIKAWSEYHGYILPAGSLNPISDAHIPPAIRQIHLAGLKDVNVPVAIIQSFSHAQKNALFLPQPNFDHNCCWVDIWPDILKTYFAQ